MKIHKLIVIGIVAITTSSVVAQRRLGEAETLGIIRTLTGNPYKTWIANGSIEALHESFTSSSSSTTNSTELVRYDGEGFYWEINIGSYISSRNSRSESVNSLDIKQNRKLSP